LGALEEKKKGGKTLTIPREKDPEEKKRGFYSITIPKGM